MIVGQVWRTTSSWMIQSTWIGVINRVIRKDLSVKPRWKVAGMSFNGSPYFNGNPYGALLRNMMQWGLKETPNDNLQSLGSPQLR